MNLSPCENELPIHLTPGPYPSFCFGLITISYTKSASAIYGFQNTITLAFDGHGNVQIYKSEGGRFDTNITAGKGIEFAFSPSMDSANSWSGWSFETSFSGGPGIANIGIGIGTSDGYAYYTGFVGMGLSLVPASLSGSLSYSWQVGDITSNSFSYEGLTGSYDSNTNSFSLSYEDYGISINSDGVTFSEN